MAAKRSRRWIFTAGGHRASVRAPNEFLATLKLSGPVRDFIDAGFVYYVRAVN